MERSFLFDKIAANIKLFEEKVSIAGVFKAPEEVLQQTTSWVLGTYCARLMELVDDKKEKYQMKKAKFELNFTSFEKIFNIIDKATSEEAAEALRACISVTGGHLQLPHLDYKNGLLVEIAQEGLYGNGIWLEQAPAGEFFVELNIVFANEVLSGSVQDKYVDALKFLKSKIGLLSQYRYMFKKFVENYEDENPDFDEEVVEYLTKNAKWGDEDRKMFKVPSGLLNVKNVSGIAELYFICQLEMKIEMEGYAGLWERSPLRNGFLGLIKIVGLTSIPYSIGSLEARLNEMKTTVRHEVDHCLAQDGIKLLSGGKRRGGLPGGSIRDKEYDDSGRKIKNPYAPTLIHPLRDIEYLPRLNDSITKFRNENVPPELLKTYMRYFVGDLDTQDYIAAQYIYDDNRKPGVPQAKDIAPDYFFKELKKNQPLKWRQAVKDFYKEVSQ